MSSVIILPVDSRQLGQRKIVRVSAGNFIAERLRSVVGAEHVLVDPAVTESYCVDWTRRFDGPALCVVRPGSTAEVAEIVRVCGEFGAPVLPQGGNTGLVGGSVPGADGPAPVIVSTRRLDWIHPVDALAGQVSAGAGATLGDVQRHVRFAGWEYGVDLAARESATIGGTVATNAGGIRVLAYGMTRAQLVGIEAVLPDGSIVSHMSGLLKDNTGLDLAGLLCGSEGTLGIITAVRLALHRPQDRTCVALIGCADYRDAIRVASTATHGRLVAAEVVDEVGMDLVCDVANLPYPLSSRHPLVLLLEVVDGGSGDGFNEPVLADRDVVVGLETGDIERLWQYRERQAEAFGTLGVIHKLDVSVPLQRMQECVTDVRKLLSDNSAVTKFGIFGHILDGNIHVEFAGPHHDDDSTDIAVLQCVAEYGGSISAEHGIGRMKAQHLGLSRSGEEISAMRAIKDAWDPQGLMNPRVLFS